MGDRSMQKDKIRDSRQDIIFYALNYMFLVLVLIVVAFPLINVISQSVSSAESVYAGRVILFPVKFTLAAYSRIATNLNILNGFLNSAIYTVVFTAISLAMTIMAAYPLSRKTFYGRTLILWIFTFTMLFSGGLIPTYLLVKSLGLRDTMWALVFPASIGVWNIILARTYFQSTIPVELYEASELDGCSDISVFLRIVIPLSKPIIAVIVLYNSVGMWNSYYDALIYLSTSSKYPLQLVLRNILMSSQLQGQLASSGTGDVASSMAQVEVLRYSVIVFSSIPVMVMYPFVQKYFTKGIMIGSLKG
jgi:putative aldouronate transport system permease protein